MNGVTTLAFPGTRALAAWWKQHAGQQPRAMWVGHLVLHRLEALVRVERLHHPELLSLHLLQALLLEAYSAHPTSNQAALFLRALDARLHLGTALIHRLLTSLAVEGLAQQGQGRWSPTSLGEQVLAGGTYPRAHEERRTFYFRELRAFESSADHAPHFLDLQNGFAQQSSGESWEFPVEHLHACLEESPEWKSRFGFPNDVCAVLTAEQEAPESWRRIIVDRPERLLCALFRVEDPTPRLLGFGARQEGWTLQSQEPAFVVKDEWAEVFPELTAPPTEVELEQSWVAWSRQRGLPLDEAEACTLRLEEDRLRVQAPASLMERLRSSRSDVLRGEAWVLIGEGAIRRAAVLEFEE